MGKDFRIWNIAKQALDATNGSALFKEREIWWCALGANVGAEQDGSGRSFSRPVLIFSKFNLDICLVLPLTSRDKKGKFYFSLGIIAGQQSTAILSQIRLVDRKRLTSKIAKLPQDQFEQLTAAFIAACIPMNHL